MTTHRIAVRRDNKRRIQRAAWKESYDFFVASLWAADMNFWAYRWLVATNASARREAVQRFRNAAFMHFPPERLPFSNNMASRLALKTFEVLAKHEYPVDPLQPINIEPDVLIALVKREHFLAYSMRDTASSPYPQSD